MTVMVWGMIGTATLLLCIAYLSKGQRQKRQLEELKKQWGKEPIQHMDAFVWQQIRTYHQLCTENCRVDQTTWNDLDMNQVFARLNATVSSPGEELLYHRLHQPEGTYLSPSEQEAWITRFAQDEHFRYTIQHILFRLGKVRTSGVSSYLFRKNTQVLRHEKAYLLMGALPQSLLFWQAPSIRRPYGDCCYVLELTSYSTIEHPIFYRPKWKAYAIWSAWCAAQIR